MGLAYDKALALYRHRRYAPAREELGRELAEQPNSSYAHALMALCYAAESNCVAGRAAAEAAITAEPTSAFAHYSLAWVLYRDTTFASARRADLHFCSNKVQDRRRRALKRAKASLQEALKLKPDNADYHGLLAFVLHDMGQYRKSLVSARQGLAIDPQHSESLKAAALGARATRSVEEAAEASEAAIRSAPDGAVAHAIHGRTLLLAGRYDEAMHHLVEGMRLDPENGYVQAQFLEGCRARFAIYRVLLRARRKGRWPIQRHGLVFSLLLLVLAIVPTSLAAWICDHLLNKKMEPGIFVLSLAPVLMLIFARRYVDFRLQFDARTNRLLSASSRSSANGSLCLYAFVLVMFMGFGIAASLGDGGAAKPFFFGGLPVLLTFLWIEMRSRKVK